MISLEEVILHPLLSGIIGLLFLVGILRASLLLFGFKSKKTLRVEELWCGYFLLLGGIASLLHVLAQSGIVPVAGGLAIGWGICLWGGLSVFSARGRFTALRPKMKSVWQDLSLGQRIDVGLIASVIGFFLLMAMAPPTDADSMNYHLVLPLEFLRFGEFVPHPEWNHAKIIGLGEYLILAGYLIRTENLSALIQFSGLIAVLTVLVARAKTHSHRILVAKLVVGVPTLLFLVVNQKPQWAGTAAVLVAASLLTNNREWDTRKMVLVVGSTLFACGLKYFFYLSGSGIFLLGLVLALRSSRGGKFLGVSIILYGLLVFPIHLGNHLHYADPIPPVLTAWLSPQLDPAATAFYAQINQPLSVSWYEKIWHLVIPHTPGHFTGLLGLGIFTVLWVPFAEWRVRWRVGILAIYALVVIDRFGTYQSRYYIDAYMLGLLLFATSRKFRRGKKLLSILVSGQLAVVAVAAGLGAIQLVPGIASFANRNQTMIRAAEYYPVAAWVDENLPEDALIINGLRKFALYPRDTLSIGSWGSFRKSPQRFLESVQLRAKDLDHVYLVFPANPLQRKPSNRFFESFRDVELIATVPFERGTRKWGFPPQEDVFYVFRLSLVSDLE